MQVIENEIMDGYQREEDSPGNDIYSLRLVPLNLVNEFFNFDDPNQDKFLDDMKDMIKNWLERLKLLLYNSEKIKKKQEDAWGVD